VFRSNLFAQGSKKDFHCTPSRTIQSGSQGSLSSSLNPNFAIGPLPKSQIQKRQVSALIRVFTELGESIGVLFLLDTFIFKKRPTAFHLSET
jgi:hypothetical protein